MSVHVKPWLGLGLWLVTVCLGYAYLVLDSLRTSELVNEQFTWPAASALPRGEEFTLVAFLHPQCGCSRASLAEIARLMADLDARTSCHLIFQQPVSQPDDWHETRLWHTARQIPGLEIHVDTDCRESVLFRASVSGEIHVYDAQGQLRFRGGVTPSRGHEGPNPGQLAIRDVILHGRSSLMTCHAYGCLLIQKAG